jgi:hypothetical protein
MTSKRLSRLQRRILAWLAAEDQRTSRRLGMNDNPEGSMQPDHLMVKIPWLYAKERQIATVMGSSAWTDLPADLRADLLRALIGELTEMRDTIRAAFYVDLMATHPLIGGRVADLHRKLETMLWLLGEDSDRTDHLDGEAEA